MHGRVRQIQKKWLIASLADKPQCLFRVQPRDITLVRVPQQSVHRIVPQQWHHRLSTTLRPTLHVI